MKKKWFISYRRGIKGIIKENNTGTYFPSHPSLTHTSLNPMQYQNMCKWQPRSVGRRGEEGVKAINEAVRVNTDTIIHKKDGIVYYH